MANIVKPPPRLSRRQVIDRALQLLDEVGLEALTMRRLAASLGVQAGAIYWHFKDKQDLQDAMAEQALEGLLEPPPKGNWEERLSELARRLLAALSRHRDGARLASEALMPGPNGLAASEAMLRILRDHGLPPKAALWAAGVLGNYVVGFAVDLQTIAAAQLRGSVMAIFRAMKRQIDPETFPILSEVDEGTIERMMGARDTRARFDFGLKVILRGLAQTRVAAPGRKSRTSR